MTAPARASLGVARGPISTSRTERYRTLLLGVMAEQVAEFDRHARTLTALTRESPDGTAARAIAALRMFGAREAIERTQIALVRLEEDILEPGSPLGDALVDGEADAAVAF